MSDDEKEKPTNQQINESNEENGGKTIDLSKELIDCGSCTFPWLASVSLFKLLICIHKVYQDGATVAVYYKQGMVYFCILSVLSLAIPAIVYTIYLVLTHIMREDGITKQDAGTNIANGLLLIPWQIRSIVEILHFSVQRVCQRRSPSREEMAEQLSLEKKSVVLEFFEDFFAGFIQLVLQTYILLTYYEKVGLTDKGRPGTRDDENRPTLMYEQFVASGLVLFSMLMAVRRKDDGILTTFLSFVGWGLIMSSRAFTIALAASVIHAGIVGFCLLHAIVFTIWLTPICWRTHTQTQLSRQKKIAIAFLIFFLFGLPSLIYWPLLFELKANKRPMIFMAIITIENAALFCTWYFLKGDKGWEDYVTSYIVVIAVGTCVGCLFILAYLKKPKYTEQIVLHDMRLTDEIYFGMYYEFFDTAFELHLSTYVEQNLHLVR